MVQVKHCIEVPYDPGLSVGTREIEFWKDRKIDCWGIPVDHGGAGMVFLRCYYRDGIGVVAASTDHGEWYVNLNPAESSVDFYFCGLRDDRIGKEETIFESVTGECESTRRKLFDNNRHARR